MPDPYPFSELDFTQDPELLLHIKPINIKVTEDYFFRVELHPHLKVVRAFNCGWVNLEVMNDAVLTHLTDLYGAPCTFLEDNPWKGAPNGEGYEAAFSCPKDFPAPIEVEFTIRGRFKYQPLPGEDTSEIVNGILQRPDQDEISLGLGSTVGFTEVELQHKAGVYDLNYKTGPDDFSFVPLEKNA